MMSRLWTLCSISFFKIGDEDFRVQPARREHDRLEPAFQKRSGDAACLVDVGAADAELGVHHRRVVENEVLLAARRAAPVDEMGRARDELFGQLLGVRDRGRRADELRVGAIEVTDATESSQDVREMRAEDTAVRVHLVDHDVAKVLEELHPFRVVRQDAAVQHVGVGDDDVAPGPDRLAGVLGCVAVVGERFDVGADILDEPVELRELVL